MEARRRGLVEAHRSHRRGEPRRRAAARSPCRRRRGTATCRPGAWLRTNQSTADCAERRRLGRAHRRAALGRRHDPERRARAAAPAPGRRARPAWRRSRADPTIAGSRPVTSPPDGGQQQRRQREPRRQRQAAQHAAPGPARRGSRCRPGRRPPAAEPGAAGSTRKRASQSSRRTTAAQRRWRASAGSMTEHPVPGRRHRPDDQHGDAEHREDLDGRATPGWSRGRRRRPTRPRSASRATTGRTR